MASDLAATTEEMAASSQEITAVTEQNSAGMEEIRVKAAESIDSLSALNSNAGNVKNTLNRMIGNVTSLADQLKSIDSISENISQVADQTNLLALNAAIEAARAGEHGRGFSVVADEVRNLAIQTKDSVKEVASISLKMNEMAVKVREAVGEVTDIFNYYVTDVNTVSGTIHESMTKLSESLKSAEDIAISTQQQAESTTNLAHIAQDLASSSDFSQLLDNDIKRIAEITKPRLILSKNEHIVSIMAARLSDHANFMRRAISLAGSGQKVVDHHECAFGKWYDANRDTYWKLEQYREIDKPHQAVHEAAALLVKNGGLSNAENLIEASVEILASFGSLAVELQK